MDETTNAEHLKLKSGLLIEHGAAVDLAFNRAVQEALVRHKREGNPVAVWQDGKVTLLMPDQLPDGMGDEEEKTVSNTSSGRR